MLVLAFLHGASYLCRSSLGALETCSALADRSPDHASLPQPKGAFPCRQRRSSIEQVCLCHSRVDFISMIKGTGVFQCYFKSGQFRVFKVDELQSSTLSFSFLRKRKHFLKADGEMPSSRQQFLNVVEYIQGYQKVKGKTEVQERSTFVRGWVNWEDAAEWFGRSYSHWTNYPSVISGYSWYFFGICCITIASRSATFCECTLLTTVNLSQK